MTQHAFTTFDLSEVEPEEGAPLAERIISGSPRFRTWNLDEAEGGVNAGVWEATPGKWRIQYDEWEYFHILSGRSIITQDGAKPMELTPGSRMVLKPGFKGTWEVLETTRKDYVIRL